MQQGNLKDSAARESAKSVKNTVHGFGKISGTCSGEDCLNCTRPASKCRGCWSNRKTVYCDTQPTRKPKGKPDKTAVKLCTKEDHA